MNRETVYEAIDSERNFQDAMTASDDRPDLVEEMSMGDTLTAIEHNLIQARAAWYGDAKPFNATTPYLRKIAALAVKAGEQFGMPLRDGYQNT